MKHRLTVGKINLWRNEVRNAWLATGYPCSDLKKAELRFQGRLF